VGEHRHQEPQYPDTVYVAELIGPDVISTMPDHTLRAFADHGQVKRTLDTDPATAERVLADATGAGIELESVTNELEREGVGAFCDSYHELLDSIERKLGTLAARRHELLGSRDPPSTSSNLSNGDR
jgi:transaldolase